MERNEFGIQEFIILIKADPSGFWQDAAVLYQVEIWEAVERLAAVA